MNYKKSHLFFEKITDISDDGFIAVDNQGFIIHINEKYCKFLGQKNVCSTIGKHIKEIIPNTKMLDVMKEKYYEENGVHHYLNKPSSERTVLVTRSFVEDEEGNVIGGIAQVKFKLQSLDIAKKLMAEYEAYEFYKSEYEKKLKNDVSFKKLIGSSNIFREKINQGKRVAKTNFSVLITGETGTGKELFAKSIHSESQRSDKPIICINCAAIPNELLETELFGYSEGAFTGAKKGGKKGKFLIADGGTIFLDEIADMPLPMQAKLLRVLQEREIEPIGSNNSIPINVRVIAATSKNLLQMIENGDFREDLFYRLNVVNIHLNPLRERKNDILELANFFIKNLNFQFKTNKKISKEVMEAFLNYTWPGNVRELDNVVKSAYATSQQNNISISDLPSKISQNPNLNCICFEKVSTLHEAVDNFEKMMIIDALNTHNWCFLNTAKALHIHRSLLYKKIKKYDIKKP